VTGPARFSLQAEGIRAVVLDIEGTTTPIAFVHDVLFPFARARLRDHLAAGRGSREIDEIIEALGREHQADAGAGQGPPAWDPGPEGAAAYARWLMDRDRKSTALKALQGLIWREAYESGALEGQVYPDVPDALARWTGAGLRVAIFSSGSALAQRLLFSRSGSGDLTPYLSAYFDTTVGPKTSPDSYAAIARALDLPPRAILFVSDVAAELDAAASAGVRTLLSIRPGNPPPPGGYQVIRTFDDVLA
jgi:enolase-phosphatase E1